MCNECETLVFKIMKLQDVTSAMFKYFDDGIHNSSRDFVKILEYEVHYMLSAQEYVKGAESHHRR